jgi:hypothetical protein
MRVDIYRRAEAHGKFSHLAVPEGKPIPQEAINTDWQDEASARELDENRERWEEFGIEQPARQIREKGYAITSLKEQTD